MSAPNATRENAQAANESPALTVGDRKDIALMSLKPRSDEGGNLIAWLYTGFNTSLGQKHFVKWSTKTPDKAKAQSTVDGVLIPKLQGLWDQAAMASGAAQCAALPDSLAYPDELTVEQYLRDLEKRWVTLRGKRKQTYNGYLTELRAFLRIAGDLARRPSRMFTLEECEEIRDTRLEDFTSDTGTPRQAMTSLHFVLERIPGFPQQLVDVFRPLKGSAALRNKKDMTFAPCERRTLWTGCKDESWLDRGQVLLGALGAMHIRDVAMSRWDSLREARDAICRRERVKNGNVFRFHMPPLLLEWADEGAVDPKAVYLFPEYIFSAEELAANPDINHKRLSKEEEQERATNAAAKLRKRFDALLTRLNLKRAGLSYRAFRHTNISEWEAGGVPRSVGMGVTGTSEEKNYIGYITATAMQFMSLSGFTLDSWRFPGRRLFLTITQGVHALMRLIIRSELRQRKATRIVHDDVRAMRVEIQRLQASIDSGKCGLGCPYAGPPAQGYPILAAQNGCGSPGASPVTETTNETEASCI